MLIYYIFAPTPQGICQFCQTLLHDDGSSSGLTNNLKNTNSIECCCNFLQESFNADTIRTWAKVDAKLKSRLGHENTTKTHTHTHTHINRDIFIESSE